MDNFLVLKQQIQIQLLRGVYTDLHNTTGPNPLAPRLLEVPN